MLPNRIDCHFSLSENFKFYLYLHTLMIFFESMKKDWYLLFIHQGIVLKEKFKYFYLINYRSKKHGRGVIFDFMWFL
jgi:hypothetical protein